MGFVCPLCARRFKSQPALTQHVQYSQKHAQSSQKHAQSSTQHVQSSTNQCALCSSLLATNTLLQQHLCLPQLQSLIISDQQPTAYGHTAIEFAQSQSDEPSFFIDSYGISLSQDVLDGLTGITTHSTPAFSCSTCLRNFDDQETLEQHLAPWSMYPELHNSVDCLLKKDGLHLNFHQIDEASDRSTSYGTWIKGAFNCGNRTCRAVRWPSGHIYVQIRLYKGSEYNARVFHQSCKRCYHVSRPALDGSYADRIAYRLKKWHGIQQTLPPYIGGKDRPHIKALCEGCKNEQCDMADTRTER